MDYEEIRRKMDDEEIKKRLSTDESEDENKRFSPPYRPESLLKKIDGMSWKQLLVIQQSIVLGIFIVFLIVFIIFFAWGWFH